MRLTFLGAAETVTGSKYLVEFGEKKLLIDCGLFQGLKSLRLLNWEEPRFDPKEIDAVLLTHGHLDHTGYLPRLVKLGFKGKIFGTEPTLKVAKIILEDAAEIQEEEAKRANKEGYSKHQPALPLYTVKDVEKTLKLFQPVKEGQWLEEGFRALFRYNGHILGSTYIELEAEGKTLVFSGDIGREKDLLLYSPKRPKHADLLLIESTYGGKIHPPEEEILPELEQIVNETLQRGGCLFIPSFAVERAQLLMVIFWRLLKEKRIPKVPMVMDSPMGADVIELFYSSKEWHKLKREECEEMCSHFWITQSFAETLKLIDDKRPKIVIAGSGMMTGGRILNYFEKRAGNAKDTLLFVGYQAEGTRGRRILDGEKEIKVYGKMVTCKMDIKKIEGLSAHADQKELLDWLSDLKEKPKHLFIVHGEREQSEALQQKIFDEKSWESEIPGINQAVEL